MEAPGDGTVVFAVDLINDTWQDYGYFVQAAGLHESKREYALRNRYLRAALANLYAHLDGVVAEVYDMLVGQRHISDRLNHGHCTLKDKMFAIRGYIQDQLRKRLPYINLDLKPIRDIINHPSIVKPNDLTYVDVYALAIPDVIEVGNQIDRWLDEACCAVGYERFADTKGSIEKILTSLNAPKGTPNEF